MKIKGKLNAKRYLPFGRAIVGVIVWVSMVSVCYGAEGAVSTLVRPLESFSKIVVGGLVNVQLEQGSSHHMTITASGIAMKNIISKVEGDTLRVTTLGRHSGEHISIRVYYKALIAIRTSGSATVKTNGVLKSNILAVEITEAGDADLALDVECLHVVMRGNGNLNLRGIAHEQTIISHGGGGRLNNSKLEIQKKSPSMESCESYQYFANAL